jgi:pimeloyl-ACP methyl ester carboxylesterase
MNNFTITTGQEALKTIYSCTSDVAEDKYSLKPIPQSLLNFSMATQPRHNLESGWPVDSFLNRQWINRAVSLIVCSSWNRFLKDINFRDMKDCIETINTISSLPDCSIPAEKKIFMIQQIITFIVAYRSSSYYQSKIGEKSLTIQLPILINGTHHIQACHYKEEIDLCGGVSVVVFVPDSGLGSPIFLFHGTFPWLGGKGACLTLLEDLNLSGPGASISLVAAKKLPPIFEKYTAEYKEKPILMGHSLGGVFATRLACDCPDSIQRVYSFNPTRQPHAVAEKWRTLEASRQLPEIFTFVSVFNGRVDIVANLGDEWVGRVFHVQANEYADVIDCHECLIPLKHRDFSLKEVETHKENMSPWRQSGVAWFAQKYIAFIANGVAYSILFPWRSGRRLITLHRSIGKDIASS